MKEYQVIFKDGMYIIKVKTIVTSGFLWWKKKHEKWVIADCYGNPFKLYPLVPPCSHFVNETAAKRHVEMWLEQQLKPKVATIIKMQFQEISQN